MFQAATEKRSGAKQCWLEMGSPRRSASSLPNRVLFAVNVMEILAQPDVYMSVLSI